MWLWVAIPVACTTQRSTPRDAQPTTWDDNQRVTVNQDLLNPVPPTLLPVDEAASLLSSGVPAIDVAAAHPTSCVTWAMLAADALQDGRTIEGYAYARVGYHRGLDLLRRNGWRGHGPVPWEHEPNRGWLSCVHYLAVAAAAIGEDAEAHRCTEFLRESSLTAATVLQK
jgi:hypothetical protein